MAELMKGQQVQGKGGKWYRYLGGPKYEKSSYEEVTVTPVNLPTMQQSMQEELNAISPGAKYLAGWGSALDRAAYGAKSLFTDLTPAEKERLALNKQTAGTLPGILGQISGDVAMTSAPFSAVSGAASLAPTVGSRLLANVGGSAALGAGYGALTTPESRTTGAVLGGAGAGAGSLLGSLLTGAFKPAAGSAAEQMQNRGIPLTIGQSAGNTTKKLEDAMRGTAGKVGARQAEALQEWGRQTAESVAPKTASVAGGAIPKSPVTEVGREAIANVAEQFNQAYDDAFSGMGKLTIDKTLSDKLDDIVASAAPKLIPSDATALVQQTNRIPGEMAAGIEGRAMKDLRGSYQKLADAAYEAGNGRLGEAYKQIKGALDSLVARQYPQAAQAVKAVDKQYSMFLPVQKAAAKIGADEGVFSPSQLMASIRELDKSPGKAAFARGVLPLMPEAQQGIKVLGPTIPPVGPGTAEKLAPALAMQNWLTVAPAAVAQGIYTKPIQGLLTGANQWQGSIDPAWLAAMGAASGQPLVKRLLGGSR